MITRRHIDHTSTTLYDKFPWPQFEASREDRKGREGKGNEPLRPSRPLREAIEQIRAVAEAARDTVRRESSMTGNERNLDFLLK